MQPADPHTALLRARTIAILGAHPERARAASYVPEYLHQQGYTVLPVNPRYAGTRLWGRRVVPRLTDLRVPVDIVDVFRRSAALASHLDEIRSMSPPPGLVWLQLGIHDDAFVEALASHGIPTISNRCTLADHGRFGIGKVGPQ